MERTILICYLGVTFANESWLGATLALSHGYDKAILQGRKLDEKMTCCFDPKKAFTEILDVAMDKESIRAGSAIVQADYQASGRKAVMPIVHCSNLKKPSQHNLDHVLQIQQQDSQQTLSDLVNTGVLNLRRFISCLKTSTSVRG